MKLSQERLKTQISAMPSKTPGVKNGIHSAQSSAPAPCQQTERDHDRCRQRREDERMRHVRLPGGQGRGQLPPGLRAAGQLPQRNSQRKENQQ